MEQRAQSGLQLEASQNRIQPLTTEPGDAGAKSLDEENKSLDGDFKQSRVSRVKRIKKMRRIGRIRPKRGLKLLRPRGTSRWSTSCPLQKREWNKLGSSSSTSWRVNALPDWPLMAVMIEQVAGQRDCIVHKSVWHLSDEAMKNVYTMYIMSHAGDAVSLGPQRIHSMMEKSTGKMEETGQCTGTMKSKKNLKQRLTEDL